MVPFVDTVMSCERHCSYAVEGSNVCACQQVPGERAGLMLLYALQFVQVVRRIQQRGEKSVFTCVDSWNGDCKGLLVVSSAIIIILTAFTTFGESC